MRGWLLPMAQPPGNIFDAVASTLLAGIWRVHRRLHAYFPVIPVALRVSIRRPAALSVLFYALAPSPLPPPPPARPRPEENLLFHAISSLLHLAEGDRPRVRVLCPLSLGIGRIAIIRVFLFLSSSLSSRQSSAPLVSRRLDKICRIISRRD